MSFNTSADYKNTHSTSLLAPTTLPSLFYSQDALNQAWPHFDTPRTLQSSRNSQRSPQLHGQVRSPIPDDNCYSRHSYFLNTHHSPIQNTSPVPDVSRGLGAESNENRIMQLHNPIHHRLPDPASMLKSTSPEIEFESIFTIPPHSSNNPAAIKCRSVLGYALDSAENIERKFGEGANEASGFNPLFYSVLHHDDPNIPTSNEATNEENSDNNAKGETDSTISLTSMQNALPSNSNSNSSSCSSLPSSSPTSHATQHQNHFRQAPPSMTPTEVDRNLVPCHVANQNRPKILPVGLGRGMGRGIKKVPKRQLSCGDSLVGGGNTSETSTNGWGELIPKTNGDDGTELWGKPDMPQIPVSFPTLNDEQRKLLEKLCEPPFPDNSVQNGMTQPLPAELGRVSYNRMQERKDKYAPAPVYKLVLQHPPPPQQNPNTHINGHHSNDFSHTAPYYHPKSTSNCGNYHIEAPMGLPPLTPNYDPHSSKNYYWINHQLEKLDRNPKTPLHDINEKHSIGKNPINLNGYKNFEHNHYVQQNTQQKQNLQRSSSASMGLYDMSHYGTNRKNTTSLSSIPQETFNLPEFASTPLYEGHVDFEEAFLPPDFNNIPHSPDIGMNLQRNISTLFSTPHYSESEHKDFIFSSLPTTLSFNPQNNYMQKLDPVAQDFNSNSTTPKFSYSDKNSALSSSEFSLFSDPFQNSSSSNASNNNMDNNSNYLYNPFANHDNNLILTSNNIKNSSTNNSSMDNNIYNSNHFNRTFTNSWNHLDGQQGRICDAQLDYTNPTHSLPSFGNSFDKHDPPWLLITGINPKIEQSQLEIALAPFGVSNLILNQGKNSNKNNAIFTVRDSAKVQHVLREKLGLDAFESIDVIYPEPTVSNFFKKFADAPPTHVAPPCTRSESWSLGPQNNFSPLVETDNNLKLQQHENDDLDYNFSMLLPNDLFTTK